MLGDDSIRGFKRLTEFGQLDHVAGGADQAHPQRGDHVFHGRHGRLDRQRLGAVALDEEREAPACQGVVLWAGLQALEEGRAAALIVSE